MKRIRRDRKSWYQPPAQIPVAVFQCRRCHSNLTGPLALLTSSSSLCQKAAQSFVPEGHYWPVAEGQDFAGLFAVSLADLLNVGYHPDHRRLIGCCGPSGSNGPNRVCSCGREIGIERSDCIWPQAVYFLPSEVLLVPPG